MDTHIGQSNGGNSSIEVSCSQITLVYVKLTKIHHHNAQSKLTLSSQINYQLFQPIPFHHDCILSPFSMNQKLLESSKFFQQIHNLIKVHSPYCFKFTELALSI